MKRLHLILLAVAASVSLQPLMAQCPTAGGAPAATAPASGSAFAAGANIGFQWTAPSAAGVQGYEVWTIEQTSHTAAIACTTTGTSCSAAITAAGLYEWFVRAKYAGCIGGGAAVDSPRRTMAVGCPSAPALATPANGATNVPTFQQFSWSNVNADQYDIYLSTGSACGSSPTATSSGTTFNPPQMTAGTTYSWKVVAKKGGCSVSSSCATFTTAAATASCPATAPSLSAPANNSTVAAGAINLSWSAVPNATSYDVYAGIDGSTPTRQTTTANTSFALNVTAGRNVTWYVLARAANCPEKQSASATFQTSGGCPTAVATLGAPANGATLTGGNVQFSWSKVADAAGYDVFLSTNSGAFAQFLTTTATTATRTLAPGTYEWYVVARFASNSCAATTSSKSRFTVLAETTCADATVTLSAPASGASVASPVSFSWSAVANATAYRVWVTATGQAPTIVARVTATSAQVALPSGSGEWFVEAIRNDCPSVISARSPLTIQSAATCGSGVPPSLVSPVGSTVAPAAAVSPVELTWTAAPGAIGYKVWLALNGQPFADSAITTATTVRPELPAGTYGWFVEALYNGCPSQRTQTAAFRIAATTSPCDHPAPAPIAPAENSSIASPVTFSWSGVADAELYRVYIVPASSETPVLIGQTPDTSLTRALPPGTGSWFVEADFRGCNSTRSRRVRFTVPLSANCTTDTANLIAPANGATNVTSPVEFSWSAVNGAVRYVVIARNASGSAVSLGETSETHLARRLPAATVEWWMVTFFAGCPPRESSHFTFTIPQPPECTNRPPLLLTPQNQSRNVTAPVTFSWTRVALAKSYRLWLAIDADEPSVAGTTTATELSLNVPPGRIRWFVEATFDGCPSVHSGVAGFQSVARSSTACGTPDKPVANVAGQVLSGTDYSVRWSPLPNVTLYEVQESATADFLQPTTQTIANATTAKFRHEVTAAQQFHYRVRGISSCAESRGMYSQVVRVYVMPPRTTNNQQHASAEAGTQQTLVQKIVLPPVSAPTPFTATSDKPWITITPSSGIVPLQGLTLNVTANPATLALGTNTGSVRVIYGETPSNVRAEGKWSITADATTPVKNVSISVSLVTPVMPAGRNTPPDDALIVAAVAHAEGANDSLFESDVRITNLAPEAQRYRLAFTPSGTDGTQSGDSTEIEVEAGGTTALDDILASFFGSGNGGAITGTLEIRPLNASTSATAVTTSNGTLGAERTTVASSRTYNVTPNGTFGQFVPAMPFASFIGKTNSAGAKNILSLQQIAQSADYRTNFGFVEGSGEPADLLVSVFGTSGTRIAQIPVSLQAGEHKQLNQLLATNGITLSDGRVEVEVTSDTGRVTAYASVLDAKTNDPLLVSPVLKSGTVANRYTVPGVGDLPNGTANWVSDMRLFNPADTAVDATLTYFPIASSGSPNTKTVTLAAGEVRVFNSVLQSFFGQTNSLGSVLVTTAGNSSLVATARTYNQTGNGTYGQFIPAVTPAESIGAGERWLQILQLEESSRLRTNIGIVETSGNAVTAEISLNLPDSRVTPKIEVALAPNEYRQFSLAQFGMGSAVYNARVAVRVLDGSGRVTAYGSVIDAQTQDPTYVPAQ